MRKLFVVGFVSVVVLIAWLLFLNLDMKRFESETSVDPVPQQDSKMVPIRGSYKTKTHTNHLKMLRNLSNRQSHLNLLPS